MGIRAKLVLLTLGLIAIVDLLVGVYLEQELRGSLEDGMWAELTRHASAARALLESSPAPETEAGADDVANRAGAATTARITIVRRDGKVLGDSEFPVEKLGALESHADRPEIRGAFEASHGESARHSTTMAEPLLYVAVPLVRPGHEPLVVRAALPRSRMQAAIARMRRAVAVAGVTSLVVAALLMLLASSLISNTLRSVVSTAQAAAHGRPGDAHSRSLSQMAADLEQAMAMLASERNRFATVLQTMDQAVLALDQTQRVTTVNRAARTLLGLRRDPQGLKLLEVVRAPALKELVESAEPGEAKSAEFDLTGGHRVEAHATVQPDGGTVIVMLDVTEIRRLERVRRDFVANVSHELRTPISVIRANTETLLEGGLEDPPRARQFVEAVLRHAVRLGRLVSDLLDISRIEAGRYPLTPRALNVADVVDHVLDSVEGDAETKNIDLAVDIDPDLLAVADRKALEQVLINLIGNAVKYTPEHGHVVVTAREDGAGVRIEVLDDGPGIDPVHRERVFERFYRVDPGRSRDMGGTGLGLSIVKHLVEAMDGQVGFDSRSPQGSVFWFTLARPEPGEPTEAQTAGETAANEAVGA